MRGYTAAILLAVTIALNFMFCPLTASAAEYYGYAYVNEGVTAYFCSEPDARKSLFAIPQTYGVVLVSEIDADWYYVKYADDDGAYVALYGYVRKSDLIPTDSKPENLYLNMTVVLRYIPEGVEGMSPLPAIEATAAFYGSYEIGGTACSYLYCNGAFGYYPQTYSYPHNALPSAPAFNRTEEEPDARLITAIVITLIAVSAVTVLYFSGKRKPTRPKE